MIRANANPDDSDDVLMRYCVLQDNTEAFSILVRRHQTRVLSYAARMLGGDLDAASDIAQEVFLRLWSGRSRYTAQAKLLSYLLHVAHNLCVSDLRSAMRHSTIPLGDACNHLDGPRLSERAEAVREAVMALPEEQRSVFVLSEYEGFSYAEIAEVLRVPAGTVASRKNRAITLLRSALRPWQNGREGGISTQ